MAGKFERHARAKSDWGIQPARSAELQAATAIDPDPAKRAPGPKDTRSWCKGKPGRPHVPEIVQTHDGFRTRECKWVAKYDYRLIRRGLDDEAATIGWLCGHEERCPACGKILRNSWELPLRECPAYPGSPEQRAEVERKAAEYPEYHRARMRPRPIITGPQGYRRKRQEAR